MNRLNFTQMVNKNLQNHQGNKFFNITQLQSEDFYQNQRYTDKIKKAQEKLNLENKINDIVFHVHEKLRERQSSPAKIKPKTIEKKSPQVNKPKSKIIKKENFTLPRLKVLHKEKQQQQQHVHNSTMTTLNTISYEDHQRMSKVVKRQKVLENLLQDQKNIQQDRKSIAQDIFAMRHCLNDLHHRIDCSLRKLNTKRTYCECHSIGNSRNCKHSFEKGIKFLPKQTF